MTDRFSQLPKELQLLIFEFDPTKREKMDAVLDQLTMCSDVVRSLQDLYFSFDFTAAHVGHRLRGIARFFRKKELKEVARFMLMTSMLPRHYTKLKLCYLMFYNIRVTSIE